MWEKLNGSGSPGSEDSWVSVRSPCSLTSAGCPSFWKQPWNWRSISAVSDLPCSHGSGSIILISWHILGLKLWFWSLTTADRNQIEWSVCDSLNVRYFFLEKWNDLYHFLRKHSGNAGNNDSCKEKPQSALSRTMWNATGLLLLLRKALLS